MSEDKPKTNQEDKGDNPLFRKWMAKLNKANLKLTTFTPIDELPDDVFGNAVRTHYRHKEVWSKLFGMILNAAFTARQSVFILSFERIRKMVTDDLTCTL